MTKFSEWYKEQLRGKGMSAGEFAQRARISRAASYFYFNGNRVPNEAALNKIAAAFELDRSTMPIFAPKK